MLEIKQLQTDGCSIVIGMEPLGTPIATILVAYPTTTSIEQVNLEDNSRIIIWNLN